LSVDCYILKGERSERDDFFIVVVFAAVRERFCHSQTPWGQNLFQFRQRYGIATRVRYAVALRKNTDSLVKGMKLFDQGGGGRGGGKRSWT